MQQAKNVVSDLAIHIFTMSLNKTDGKKMKNEIVMCEISSVFRWKRINDY